MAKKRSARLIRLDKVIPFHPWDPKDAEPINPRIIFGGEEGSLQELAGLSERELYRFFHENFFDHGYLEEGASPAKRYRDWRVLVAHAVYRWGRQARHDAQDEAYFEELLRLAKERLPGDLPDPRPDYRGSLDASKVTALVFDKMDTPEFFGEITPFEPALKNPYRFIDRWVFRKGTSLPEERLVSRGRLYAYRALGKLQPDRPLVCAILEIGGSEAK